MSTDRSLFRLELLERSAYEIRGLVGIVAFALEELGGSLSSHVTPAKHDMVHRGRRGLNKLLRVSDRLLRVAQIESANVRLTRESTSLRSLIDLSVADARAIESRPEVEVEVEPLPEAIRVVADPLWLRAAMSEVVAAAIRQARRHVRIGKLEDDGGLVLAVEDDGFRSVRERDVFQELPLLIAEASIRAHGWSFSREEEAGEAHNGLRRSGRVVLALYEHL
jgi:K+-sensing histidine kinase KdpD